MMEEEKNAFHRSCLLKDANEKAQRGAEAIRRRKEKATAEKVIEIICFFSFSFPFHRKIHIHAQYALYFSSNRFVTCIYITFNQR